MRNVCRFNLLPTCVTVGKLICVVLWFTFLIFTSTLMQAAIFIFCCYLVCDLNANSFCCELGAASRCLAHPAEIRVGNAESLAAFRIAVRRLESKRTEKHCLSVPNIRSSRRSSPSPYRLNKLYKYPTAKHRFRRKEFLSFLPSWCLQYSELYH